MFKKYLLIFGIIIISLTIVFATGCIGFPTESVSDKSIVEDDNKRMDVGVTVQPWSDSVGHGVTVLVYGGQDAGKLKSMNVTIDSVASGNMRLDGTNSNTEITKPVIGQGYKFLVVSPTTELADVRVTVRGYFTDDTTSTLARTTLTIPRIGDYLDSSSAVIYNPANL